MGVLYECRFIILMKSAFSRQGENEIPKILNTRLHFYPPLLFPSCPNYDPFFPLHRFDCRLAQLSTLLPSFLTCLLRLTISQEVQLRKRTSRTYVSELRQTEIQATCSLVCPRISRILNLAYLNLVPSCYRFRHRVLPFQNRIFSR